MVMERRGRIKIPSSGVFFAWRAAIMAAAASPMGRAIADLTNPMISRQYGVVKCNATVLESPGVIACGLV